MKKIILAMLVLVAAGQCDLEAQALKFTPLRGQRNARLEQAVKEKTERENKEKKDEAESGTGKDEAESGTSKETTANEACSATSTSVDPDSPLVPLHKWHGTTPTQSSRSAQDSQSSSAAQGSHSAQGSSAAQSLQSHSAQSSHSAQGSQSSSVAQGSQTSHSAQGSQSSHVAQGSYFDHNAHSGYSAYTPLHSSEITLAVMMPFNLDAASVAEEKIQMRSVEFYEGLLMAVDKAQERGQHIRVLAYDLGTQTLDEVLADESLKEARVIVAPMEAAQVKRVAAYGEQHGIDVVSPFVFCKDLEHGYPHLYQLNTSKALLYPRLSQEIVDRFGSWQVVFVRDSLYTTGLDPYPEVLRQTLKEHGIVYQQYTYTSPQTLVQMDSLLGLTGLDVLYVPELPVADASLKPALKRFFPGMKSKLFVDVNPEWSSVLASVSSADDTTGEATDATADTLAFDKADTVRLGRQVAILGYPEWQKHMADFMEDMYDQNVWMFSKFYINPFDEEVQAFYDGFRNWYNRELMSLYPKYGLLGYDVATYALESLHRYGQLAGGAEDGVPTGTLQSAVCFARDIDTDSYLNRSFYLVHFTPQATVEKHEIR